MKWKILISMRMRSINKQKRNACISLSQAYLQTIQTFSIGMQLNWGRFCPENAWNVFWDNYYEKRLVVDASPLLHEKVVGRQPNQKSQINTLSSNYIWKFGLKGNEGMAYFMNSSGEGRHTVNYDDPSPSELINFRRACYLYYAMRKGTPSMVILDKSLEENYFYLDVKFDTLCKESKQFNWAFELNSDELISRIDFNGFNYLRLYCNQFAENLKEFNGYIRNPNDKRMHLAFGQYSLVNLVKYYTFQNRDPQNDTSCQLNFSCVCPMIQYDAKSRQNMIQICTWLAMTELKNLPTWETTHPEGNSWL